MALLIDGVSVYALRLTGMLRHRTLVPDLSGQLLPTMALWTHDFLSVLPVYSGSSRSEIDRLLRETHNVVGRVDILVNNAGIFPFAPTAQTDEATFDETITLNVKGPFYLTAALAPQMAEQGSGKIINITTMVAHVGMPGMALYGATKAALTLLTKSWAAEFGPRGVNVNAIAPGPTRTPSSAVMGEGLDHLASSLPAGRPALPAEIAEAAVYLASDEANFVNRLLDRALPHPFGLRSPSPNSSSLA